MKEIRLYFYKSMRKNAKCKIKSYCIYNGFKNGKNEFKKTMDFYDAIDYISNYGYTKTSKSHYISIAATNYNSGSFFSVNDQTKSNFLDIPESKRFNVDNKAELIELVKLLYHYMILFNADFDYTYNPFTDSNVIYHIGDLTK